MGPGRLASPRGRGPEASNRGGRTALRRGTTSLGDLPPALRNPTRAAARPGPCRASPRVRRAGAAMSRTYRLEWMHTQTQPVGPLAPTASHFYWLSLGIFLLT